GAARDEIGLEVERERRALRADPGQRRSPERLCRVDARRAAEQRARTRHHRCELARERRGQTGEREPFLAQHALDGREDDALLLPLGPAQRPRLARERVRERLLLCSELGPRAYELLERLVRRSAEQARVAAGQPAERIGHRLEAQQLLEEVAPRAAREGLELR